MGEIQDEAQDLLRRCNQLLSELDQFEQLLTGTKKPPVYGHRTLMQDTQAEKRFIERLLLDSPESGGRIKHQLSSTNLASYEAIWATVKQCRGLVALRQTFWRNPSEPKPSHRGLSPASKAAADRKKTRDGVLVDAVVEGGAEWVKVSAISERQLIFQMARQGWHNDSDSDSDDEDSGRPGPGAIDLDDDSDDDEDEVGIVKTARALARAARANRYKYRHPRVRLVLVKITEGRIKEVDALLARIRSSTGIELETSSTTTTSSSSSSPAPSPSPSPTLTTLLHDATHAFTPTLNIDCTLLVALASDISHSRVAPQPWYPGAVRAQIRDEASSALLPRALYPALAGRQLVCTAAAARRMREIVATIGTETEVARAGILLDGGGGDELDAGEAVTAAEAEGAPPSLLDQLQALSIHAVPADLQLPIRIVQTPYDDADPSAQDPDPALPPVARAVAAKLTPINRSIFLYGWAVGATTLSSNGTVARQIEGLVERHRTRDDEVGPDVWVCPVARSLVAKRGRRE
ncbi:uncharacterized protein K452DRAFT_255486, partial [Aplosporella prunicola CBS 121167]